MTRLTSVTDHAVIRYMERVMGVDIAGLRTHIETATARGNALGAPAVKVLGAHFLIRDNVIVTCIDGRIIVGDQVLSRLLASDIDHGAEA